MLSAGCHTAGRMFGQVPGPPDAAENFGAASLEFGYSPREFVHVWTQ